MADKQKSKTHQQPRIWLQRLASFIALPVILLSWQYCASRVNQPDLLPSPIQVLLELLQPSENPDQPGTIWFHTGISALRVSIGFFLAALITLPLGIISGFSQFLKGFIAPFTALLRPLCPIAWLPFAAVAFKMTTISNPTEVISPNSILQYLTPGVIFIIFWGAFFPMLVTTSDAITAVHRRYLRLTAKLNLTKLQAFRNVYLPAATPLILSGIKHSLAMAWFVLIIAEMLPGTEKGIGILLTESLKSDNMLIVVSCMVIISITCIIMGTMAASVTARIFKPPKNMPIQKEKTTSKTHTKDGE